VSWLAGSSTKVAASPIRSSSDSSHNICDWKTRPKLREAAVATSSIVNVFCNSRSMEVTGLPVMPQGTINEKNSRSVLTLSANP